MLPFCPLEIPIKILSLTADVHVEDSGFYLSLMFLGDNRLFDGVHTADGGTVFVSILAGHIPGSRTLNPGNLPGRFSIGGPEKGSLMRTRSAQDALELDAGDHVGVSTISITIQPCGIEFIEARAQDHRSHLDIEDLLIHIVNNCLRFTY